MVEEEENKQIYTADEVGEIFRNIQEGKESQFSFFTRVIKNKDSTKIGNVDSDELGISTHPVRTYKELELFCDKICDDEWTADYYNQLAEIQLGTSLSKGGFLIKQVGTSRKEVADMTPKRKENKGWFKGGKKNENEQQA